MEEPADEPVPAPEPEEPVEEPEPDEPAEEPEPDEPAEEPEPDEPAEESEEPDLSDWDNRSDDERYRSVLDDNVFNDDAPSRPATLGDNPDDSAFESWGPTPIADEIIVTDGEFVRVGAVLPDWVDRGVAVFFTDDGEPLGLLPLHRSDAPVEGSSIMEALAGEDYWLMLADNFDFELPATIRADMVIGDAEFLEVAEVGTFTIR